MLATLRNNAV